jgi:hypothetical protein
MKVITSTLIALAVVSTSAVGAMARDGIADRTMTQQGTDTYDSYTIVEDGPVIVDESPVVVFTPWAHVNGSDRAIIRQNARDPK